MPPTQPTEIQKKFWNQWNSSTREIEIHNVSIEQAEVIHSWLVQTDRTDLRIIDVGCGAGWLCGQLVQFGQVTGTDLSDQVLERAAKREPAVEFISGDFMELEFPEEAYDVVVTLEVLSHVSDQDAFIRKIHRMLRPGGLLMIATQNRPALEKNIIPPPGPGQLRKWLNKDELRSLLEPDYVVQEIFSITPQFNRGPRRILNSPKAMRALNFLGLERMATYIKRAQERAWQGWTLMALARKPTKSVSITHH